MSAPQSEPLPSGVVTFLFTDVVGSTRLWESEPVAMGTAMIRHDEIIEAAVQSAGGLVVRPRGEGDSRFAVFLSPRAGLVAVAELSLALQAEPWTTAVPIRVRAALHTGEADLRAGDYYGDVVNRCARLRGLGHPGQVLVASTTASMTSADLPAGFGLEDLGEHRMKDLTRPERVFQLTHPALPAEFPALLSLDRAKHNLPVQLSSFVGRESDVAAVRDLIKSHRLVSITGFGGMGKTRLALQVAAELADGDGDGVWFVDLSAETDPTRLAPAVAAVLGIAESGDGPAAAVGRWLADKRLLLVLDNLEQILECATFVADLLAGSPQVRIITTTRARLRIRGEYEYSLAPLGLVGADDDTDDAAALGSYAAVRLFVDRAVEARPDFSVTNANAPAVAAICARLEGHPLSIELAAARIKVLGPEALLARLDTAFDLLTSSGGDRPARQQTLRATIAWSYRALSEPAQKVLDSLSVFNSTATVAAIEDVCQPVVASASQLLDSLTELVDNSLVRIEAPADGDTEPRFGMLVSIRDYAAESLAARDFAGEVARRHAAYYTKLAHPPTNPTPDQVRSTGATINREVQNLRAAVDFIQRHASPEEEIAFFTGEFQNCLVMQAQFDEVKSMAKHALARHPGAAEGTVSLHQTLSALYYFTGEADKAREEVRAMLADARRLGRPELHAYAAMEAIWHARTANEVRACVREADEAIAALPPTGTDPPRWALVREWRLAVTPAMRYVDPDRALTAAKDLAEAADSDNLTRLEATRNIAVVLMDRGDYEAARRHSQALEEALTDPGIEPMRRLTWHEHLARLSLGLGDTARAVEIAREAMRLAEDVGATRNSSRLYLLLAECVHRQGDLDAAIDALRLAHTEAVSGGDPAAIGSAQWRLSRTLCEIGQAEESAGLLGSAWSNLAGRQVRSLPDVLGCLLERAVQAPDAGEAAQLLGLVDAHRHDFVLPMRVGADIASLHTALRARLGDEQLARLLALAHTRELPAAGDAR